MQTNIRINLTNILRKNKQNFKTWILKIQKHINCVLKTLKLSLFTKYHYLMKSYRILIQ